MRREEKWLAAIAEHSSDAIIVLDQKRIIRYANTMAAAMAGRGRAEEVVGVPYDSVIDSSTIRSVNGKALRPELLPTHRALQSGEPTTEAIFEHMQSGEHFWRLVSAYPIREESGVISHAVLFIRDISQRKLREEKLKFLVESSKILSITDDNNSRLVEKARLTVPALADWCTVNIVNAEGSLSRIAIVHRDPSKEFLVERLAELSAKEMDASIGIYGVLHSGASQFSPIVDQQFLSATAPSDERITLAQKLQVCSSMIVPIKSNGRVVGVLSLAYAESGRHYTQADLEFMEDFCHHLGLLIHNAHLYGEIRKRDEAKDAFLAALSHELRNPLAPIKSALELLKIKTADDTSLQEEVAIIEHQFDHLTKLLNDLLDVSRYTMRRITLERRGLSLFAMLRRIEQAHRPFIESNGVDFSVSLPEKDIAVHADETRLEQAITNLLHNAEKFTPPGGRIEIRVTREGNAARITVRDTGIGMGKSEAEDIFESFGRRSQKHAGQGLGIGLVLVREIVRLHEGKVHASSGGSGKGSEFTIVLPAV